MKLHQHTVACRRRNGQSVCRGYAARQRYLCESDDERQSCTRKQASNLSVFAADMSASKAHSTIARGVCPHPSLPIVHPTLRSCTGTVLTPSLEESKHCCCCNMTETSRRDRIQRAPPQSTSTSAHHFDVSGLNV